MQIITLAQAREHLRAGGSADDGDLQIKIDAATEAVIDYISVPVTALFDPDGKPKLGDDDQVVKGANRVRQAILLTVGFFYDERDGAMPGAVDGAHGYGFALPKAATALLYSMRLPTAL